ncbi:MAG: trigger factor [Lachnospiraceae bacterium]|nr:trigger factor [Lachnospiraceae bacterium]
MKRKVLVALLLGTACLAAGCSKKSAETEKATEKVVTEAAAEAGATEASATEASAAETETAAKTASSDETETETAAEAVTEAASEEATEAATEAASESAEDTTEAASEAAEEETEAELGERPEYTALDYVTLGVYTGLEVTVDPIEVTEEEIDSSVEGAITSADKYDEIADGTVENGDVVNIDYEGKLDGTAFDGGTATGYDLTIGSGSFIEGFEEGLIGAKAGDTLDLNLTFPEDYSSTDLAGKETVFTVKVNAVKRMPEVTDDLVGELSDGEYTTVDAYRTYMKEQLLQDKEATQQNTISSELMTQLYNTCKVNDYPQDLVDYSVASMSNTYKGYAESYGMEFADFISTYFGMTEDEFNTEVEASVKQSLEQELILKAIAEQEEITVSDDEYETGCANYAEQFGYESADALKEAFDKQTIEISLLMDKVLDFVTENSVITETAETESESETEAVSEAASEEAAEAATEAASEAASEEAATEAASEAASEEATEAASEAAEDVTEAAE